jgi:hypothetical protein
MKTTDYIKNFTIDLKDIYTHVCEQHWMNVAADSGMTDTLEFIKACSKPQIMSEVLRLFSTEVLPNFDDIELHCVVNSEEIGCNPQQVPYVITIKNNGKVWGVFHSQDIKW